MEIKNVWHITCVSNDSNVCFYEKWKLQMLQFTMMNERFSFCFCSAQSRWDFMQFVQNEIFLFLFLFFLLSCLCVIFGAKGIKHWMYIRCAYSSTMFKILNVGSNAMTSNLYGEWTCKLLIWLWIRLRFLLIHFNIQNSVTFLRLCRLLQFVGRDYFIVTYDIQYE